MQNIKNIITLFVLLLPTIRANAQDKVVDFSKEIQSLQTENNKLKSEYKDLKDKVTKLDTDFSDANKQFRVKLTKFDEASLKATKSLDSLKNKIQQNTSDISQKNEELGLKISSTEKNTNQKITAVDESLDKNSLYGIIGVLSAILLSGLLYWLLNKRQKTDKIDLIEQLSKTKSSIEESLVKEFGKQTELMETQLQLIEQQKTTTQTTPNAEPDHSLALKFADQIITIERSVGLMDEKTKGLQRIKNSITNLKDNLSANGYEMPELIGKAFNQGMKVIVTSSIPDENLKKGEEIITKIIKPQVNFNDKMIQAAQVEVSVGY